MTLITYYELIQTLYPCNGPSSTFLFYLCQKLQRSGYLVMENFAVPFIPNLLGNKNEFSGHHPPWESSQPIDLRPPVCNAPTVGLVGWLELCRA